MKFHASFEEGLIFDMDEADYHSLQYTSQSFLNSMSEMYPEQAQYARVNPKEPTDAKKFGTAVHFAILQPDKFDSKYVIAPTCCAITGKGKPCENNATYLMEDGSWLCGMHSRKPEGRAKIQPETISTEDRDKVLAIRDKVYADPRARVLLEIAGHKREVTALFLDPPTGMKCKMRMDVYAGEYGVINDIKTTINIHDFKKSFYNYGYYWQNGYYRYGTSILYQKGLIPKPCSQFNFIVVDKEPPHVVGVFSTPEDQYDLAIAEMRPYMDLTARCEKSGIWPGHGYNWEDGTYLVEDVRIDEFKAREIQRNSILGEIGNV